MTTEELRCPCRVAQFAIGCPIHDPVHAPAVDQADKGDERLRALHEHARQVHARHDLGHKLGAWPNACALCEAFAGMGGE